MDIINFANYKVRYFRPIYNIISRMEKQINQKIQEMHLDDHEEHYDQNSQNEEEQEMENCKWEKIQQPEKKVPLFMVDFQQCDSKKCTGKKMERFRLLSTIKDKKKKYKGVVLSAFGKKTISKEDIEYIEKYGICVIDCSWNRIEETRQFRYKHERKLPFVIAGNPVNFGKPYQLSCVEAMATALCAVGYTPQAKYILSKFGWADGFWKQNPEILDYATCENMQQVQATSKQIQEREEKGFQRNYDYPSDESEQEGNQKFQESEKDKITK